MKKAAFLIAILSLLMAPSLALADLAECKGDLEFVYPDGNTPITPDTHIFVAGINDSFYGTLCLGSVYGERSLDLVDTAGSSVPFEVKTIGNFDSVLVPSSPLVIGESYTLFLSSSGSFQGPTFTVEDGAAAPAPTEAPTIDIVDATVTVARSDSSDSGSGSNPNLYLSRLDARISVASTDDPGAQLYRLSIPASDYAVTKVASAPGEPTIFQIQWRLQTTDTNLRSQAPVVEREVCYLVEAVNVGGNASPKAEICAVPTLANPQFLDNLDEGCSATPSSKRSNAPGNAIAFGLLLLGLCLRPRRYAV